MIYGTKKTLLLTILLGFLTLFLGLKYALAQQTPPNYDVTVSPVFFDLSSNPGDTISDKIRIRNNTTSPLPIKVTVKKLTGDVNGSLTLRDTSADDSLSWIKFSQDKIVAKPLEWSDIGFTITIPKEAAYGYYFAISLEQDSTSPLAKTGAKITGAAAVPILLNVRKAGAKAEAKIVSFSTQSPVLEYLPVNFNVSVENVGNIHILPHGNIFITNGSNKTVATLDVNPTNGTVIPGTKRVFTPSWDDGFLVKEPVIENGQAKLDKNGQKEEKITINWNKLTSFRVGKYTANLLLVFDNGKRDVSLESTISFWVIPYKAIIIIIVTFILALLIIRLLIRRYIRRQIRKGLGEKSS
ncbi:MAG TPA: hypothetical protein VES68_01355 [Candidatus Sulfotelmatobacter sp.]|nr:hypothetical protein [Candidatus Sulfotelmatobacter sp.]